MLLLQRKVGHGHLCRKYLQIMIVLEHDKDLQAPADTREKELCHNSLTQEIHKKEQMTLELYWRTNLYHESLVDFSTRLVKHFQQNLPCN